MVLSVFFAFLCALGVLLLVWLAVGWLLLPARRASLTVWILDGDESAVERELCLWRWLHETGLLRGSLFLLDTRTETDRTLMKLTEDIEYINYVNIFQ